MALVVALVAGAVIGLLLGALGGGGSILTIPVLVYALGQDTASATTASLIIVGISSLIASARYAASGRVRWGPGLGFGLIGSTTALLGAVASRSVPSSILLLAFAALMLVVATVMGYRNRPGLAARSGVAAPPSAAGNSAWKNKALVLAAALVVGLLTGFFGVGGGFVIVPALVLALRMPMPIAVATSLVVISINSAAGLLARWGSVDVPWRIVVPFTLAAVATSLLGKAVTDRISSTTLTRAFVVLLVAVAGYVATQAALDL